MSASAFELDNLTLIIDNNRIQKMDFIKNIMSSDDLGTKFAAFDWIVKSVDGHDRAKLKAALTGEWDQGKPRCVVAQTVKGKGLSLMENNPAWHWRMPSKKELRVFVRELDITEEELAQCKKRI
jgi:transketolase